MLARIVSVWSLGFILLTLTVYGSVDIMETRQAIWMTRSYTITLPEPYGEINLTVILNDAQEIENFNVKINGEEILIGKEHYFGLKNPGEVEIAYAIPEVMESKMVDYIQFFFEFGESRHYDSCPSLPDDENSCYSGSEKDIRLIQITKNLEVTSRTVSTADIINNRP